jgi:hypothetical protein
LQVLPIVEVVALGDSSEGGEVIRVDMVYRASPRIPPACCALVYSAGKRDRIDSTAFGKHTISK